MVVTRTAVKVGVGAIVFVSGCLRVQRITQRIDDLVLVALGQADAVGQTLGHRLEAQRVEVARRFAGHSMAGGVGQSRRAQQPRTGCAHRPQQYPPAAQTRIQHLRKCLIRAVVVDCCIGQGAGFGVVGHALSQGWLKDGAKY